jgi:hypothetical protein
VLVSKLDPAADDRVADPHPNDLAARLAELQRDNDTLREEVERAREVTQAVGQFPPGHYYSPYPDLADVRDRASELWPASPPRELPGIALNEAFQLELLAKFAPFHGEFHFPHIATPGSRFYFQNEVFGYGDATALYSMLRHLRPQRLIEVGAGFSSALILDVNERFMGNSLDFTLIEPYPGRLLALLAPGDLERISLNETRLQDVALSAFDSLRDGDILFVDSTHVSKIGSDVNHLFFEVLPRLAAGVYVHFHDILYPFEYPREWVEDQRYAWNEAYVLRAFLQYNQAFEIAFFNRFVATFHPETVEETIPTLLLQPGGSIWLRKLDPTAQVG